MKKVINGRLYNTETAKHIGNYSNDLSYDDLKYFDEDLYLKKTGEFFLSGSSGAFGKYAESVGANSWCGGSGIVPITEQEAKEWVEMHLDADTYIELFGEPEE